MFDYGGRHTLQIRCAAFSGHFYFYFLLHFIVVTACYKFDWRRFMVVASDSCAKTLTFHYLLLNKLKMQKLILCESNFIIYTICRYTNSISLQVTHVLAGDDAGPAKLAKAEELGIKIINEDEFLKMIKDSTDKHKHSNQKVENVHRKSVNRDKSKEKKTNNHVESNKKVTKTEDIKIKDSKSSLTNGTSKKERSVSPKPIEGKDEVKSETKTDPTVNGTYSLFHQTVAVLTVISHFAHPNIIWLGYQFTSF